MQEDTEFDPNFPATVEFLDSVKAWENIRFRGEDVKAGSVLLQPGVVLAAAQIALLGAIGANNLRVTRQPILGLLATGSELREPGEKLLPGQIFESNRSALAASARMIGAVPKIYPLVADTLETTRAALEKAFSECDAVVTTGGVSVGEFDFVKTAFSELGGKIDFWKIAMKPGKPFVFGKLGEKALFGLPGNPVSAFVTFLLLVAPALKKMQRAADLNWPTHPGTLTQTLENRGGRRHFVRVSVDAHGNVRSAGTQTSHILSSLAAANGLVEIPRESVLEKGTTVSVLRWNF
jgi:molybdopterin molybdotransferase